TSNVTSNIVNVHVHDVISQDEFKIVYHTLPTYDNVYNKYNDKAHDSSPTTSLYVDDSLDELLLCENMFDSGVGYASDHELVINDALSLLTIECEFGTPFYSPFEIVAHNDTPLIIYFTSPSSISIDCPCYSSPLPPLSSSSIDDITLITTIDSTSRISIDIPCSYPIPPLYSSSTDVIPLITTAYSTTSISIDIPFSSLLPPLSFSSTTMIHDASTIHINISPSNSNISIDIP
ncbi:hypothetical protein KI387_004818, partial [Taxus chinensis]